MVDRDKIAYAWNVICSDIIDRTKTKFLDFMVKSELRVDNFTTEKFDGCWPPSDSGDGMDGFAYPSMSFNLKLDASGVLVSKQVKIRLIKNGSSFKVGVEVLADVSILKQLFCQKSKLYWTRH